MSVITLAPLAHRSRAVAVLMIAAVSVSPFSARACDFGLQSASNSRPGPRFVTPTRRISRRKNVVAASSSQTSHVAVVAVPTAAKTAPAGLQLTTPGLVFGALLGGLPFVAWLLRRNDEDAPGKWASRRGTSEALPMSGLGGSANSAETRGATTSAIGSPLLNPLFETCVYLDYNATTPVFPEVASACTPFLWHHFGNPSSGHAFSVSTRDAIATARAQVAKTINCEPSEIVFTSCGSESDNHAIQSAVEHFHSQKIDNKSRTGEVPHVVASEIEHPAILEYLIHGKKRGTLDFTLVKVNSEGIVDPVDIASAVKPNTVLMSLMHANNEVGSVQPVAECAKAARGKNPKILIHCDASQSLGKIPVDVAALDVDYLTIVGHKIGAPKGVAATFAKNGAPWCKLIHGGGQENGRRAGTENVVLIVALGAACALIDTEKDKLPRYMEACCDELRRILSAELGDYTQVGEENNADPANSLSGLRFNGPTDRSLRLPNTVSVGIKGTSASVLLENLAHSNGVAASAGAACHSGETGASISGVLLAMEVPESYAVGTLRLSVGRHTTVEDIENGAARIIEVARKQRAEIDAMPEGERPWWCVRNIPKMFVNSAAK